MCFRTNSEFLVNPSQQCLGSGEGGVWGEILLLKSSEKLSEYIKVDNNTDKMSKLDGFSLPEYIETCEELSFGTFTPCERCGQLLKVANKIIDDGYIKLTEAFRMCNPNIQYKSHNAKRKLLQMPLRAIKITVNNTNTIYLVSKTSNLRLVRSLLMKIENVESDTTCMSKDAVSHLLNLAESDAERERIVFAISGSSGYSNTKLRKTYGFERLTERCQRIQNALVETQEIREAVESMAYIKEVALLRSVGIQVDSDSSSEDDQSETDSETEGIFTQTTAADGKCAPGTLKTRSTTLWSCQTGIESVSPTRTDYLNSHELLEILRGLQFNWFAFVEFLSSKCANQSNISVDQLLLEFSDKLPFLQLSEREERLRHFFYKRD